ncbi:MAG: hypothetical protein M1827_007584 [Pycnora praestabilis]|nr:MAG: hypothetical protein M1827_007584 [Pycnora praestabilis]
MKHSSLLSLTLLIIAPLIVLAQTNVPTTTIVSLASASASAAPSSYPTGTAAGGNDASSGVDNEAGASGSDAGAFNLSTGAEAAIIVAVSVVAIAGIASAILFYLAKKRSWEIRKSIRRSARRLTGNFKTSKSQQASRKRQGLSRIPEATPISRKTQDVEKGKVQMSTFEVEAPTPKERSWRQALWGGKDLGR